MASEIREGGRFQFHQGRWSCGKRWGDDDLNKDLMNKNLAHRPSLIDRSTERLDTTPRDGGDMNYVVEEGGNKELKARVKNDVGINHGELNIKRKGGG
jgi:hypothetical protein